MDKTIVAIVILVAVMIGLSYLACYFMIQAIAQALADTARILTLGY
jgi:hypothetical protein